MKKKTIIISGSVLIAIIAAVLVLINFTNNPLNPAYVGKILPLDPTTVAVDSETGMEYVSNQLIICFSNDAKKKDINNVIDSINGEIVGYLAGLNIYQVRIKTIATVENLKDIKNNLRKNSLVTAVSLNTISQPSYDSKSPVDPWVEGYKQGDTIWDESNPSGSNWGFEAVKAPSAWQYNDRIEKVNIGIVDGGFYINNKELNINKNTASGVNNKFLQPGVEFNDSDKNPDFFNTHGTAVAGVIGSIPNNGIGIAGMMKNRDLYVFRTDFDQFSTIYGIGWCVLGKNSSIVNLSLGYVYSLDEDGKKEHKSIKNGEMNPETDDFIVTQDDLFSDILTKLLIKTDDQVLIVQGAGNDGIDSRWSGYFCAVKDSELRKHIIVVGGVKNNTDNSENHINYSKYSDSNYGSYVDVVAPGQNVYHLSNPAKQFETESGTSLSAPFVTGLAGLVKGANPNLSCQEIKQIIVQTAEKAFDYNGLPYNMINAQRAVEKALGVNESPPATTTQPVTTTTPQTTIAQTTTEPAILFTDEDFKSLAIEADKRLCAVLYRLTKVFFEVPKISNKSEFTDYLGAYWSSSVVESLWPNFEYDITHDNAHGVNDPGFFLGWVSYYNGGIGYNGNQGYFAVSPPPGKPEPEYIELPPELSVSIKSNSMVSVRGKTSYSDIGDETDNYEIREINFEKMNINGKEAWRACSIKFYELNGTYKNQWEYTNSNLY